MDRVALASPDEPTIAPMLARPTSATRRFRGRIERLRLAWRRVAFAAGAGLLAAAATMTWPPALPSGSSPPDPASTTVDDRGTAVAGIDRPTPRHVPSDRATLTEDQRILALDRSAIALPVSVGSVVEVLGLRPTIDDVRAEVIAGRAQVVGVTEEAILVAVEADAAYTAAEVAAVGSVTILGRDEGGSGS